MYLGIEIGGTKLQLGVGTGRGDPLAALERLDVEPDDGASAMMPAASVPTMTARLVIILIVPLARLRSRDSTNSGIMPYLAGPKNALWQVKPIKAKRVSQRLPIQNPARATRAMGISTTLTSTLT